MNKALRTQLEAEMKLNLDSAAHIKALLENATALEKMKKNDTKKEKLPFLVRFKKWLDGQAMSDMCREGYVRAIGKAFITAGKPINVSTVQAELNSQRLLRDKYKSGTTSYKRHSNVVSALNKCMDFLLFSGIVG